MVYKLYGNIAGLKQLDVSSDEKDIIDTIGEYMRTGVITNYIIVLQTEQGDEPYKLIKNVKDYWSYQEEYNAKQEGMKIYKKA